MAYFSNQLTLDVDTKKMKFIKHAEVSALYGYGDDASVIGYKQKLVTCESVEEGDDRTSSVFSLVATFSYFTSS